MMSVGLLFVIYSIEAVILIEIVSFDRCSIRNNILKKIINISKKTFI